MWLTPWNSDAPPLVALFGRHNPEPLQVGTASTGVLEAGGAALFSMDLTPGPYRATLDFSVAPRAAGVLRGYAGVVDSADGDEAWPAVIENHAVTSRASGSVAVQSRRSHFVRIQNTGDTPVNDLFKLTRPGS